MSKAEKYPHVLAGLGDLWVGAFWSGVDKKGPDECWEWTRGYTGNGYGNFAYKRTDMASHRAAFLIANNYLPECVCHKCDNPRCCNPSHLFPGTTAENMADKVRKCRQARHEKNGRSKLSDDLVAQIREKLKDGATKRGLAREYGVSDTLIRYIAKGKIWV